MRRAILQIMAGAAIYSVVFFVTMVVLNAIDNL